MKLFKRKQRVEKSYYLRMKKRQARKRAFKKYLMILIFLLIVPALLILYYGNSLHKAQDRTIESINNNYIIDGIKAHTELLKAREAKLSRYDEKLEQLGEMGQAIKRAGLEFGEDDDEAIKLIGLMIGIANAESSLGKNFVVAYDKNCHNWWGLKGGNMTKRKDGSHLRCFINEDAGARTMAKTLKLYYLDEGRDTPEKIVTKYVGSHWSQYHNHWVNNVNYYLNN